jgi:phosphatidylethanolamine-binding protein (PEBP) family uncharacterized protein
MRLILAAAYLFATPIFAQTLTVDWDWKRSHQCSSKSPEIRVSGIPEGAKALGVTMVDHDMRSFDHGGGSLPVVGGPAITIPESALQNYRGPCPPNFSSFGHDYEFTVRALGADGKTELAKGSKVKTFSANTVKD